MVLSATHGNKKQNGKEVKSPRATWSTEEHFNLLLSLDEMKHWLHQGVTADKTALNLPVLIFFYSYPSGEIEWALLVPDAKCLAQLNTTQ